MILAPHVSPFVFSYDFRVDPAKTSREKVRAFDLVARDSKRLLSCDRHVWASPEADVDLSDVQARTLEQVRLKASEHPGAWLIALELRSALRDSEGGGEFWPSDPAVVSQDWTFLGIDVADYGLLSAINFFGLGKHNELSDRIARSLNENGLFTSDQSAATFVCEVDALFPDDAPFYSIGLWLAE